MRVNQVLRFSCFTVEQHQNIIPALTNLLNICSAISQEQLCFCVSLSEASCVKSDNVLLRPADTQPAGCWEALGWINRTDFLNSTSKHTPLAVMELLIVMLSQAVLWREGRLLQLLFLSCFESVVIFLSQTYTWTTDWLEKKWIYVCSNVIFNLWIFVLFKSNIIW